mmetsp:Transcript_30962/g.77430  ORF Transcript_30962/g.77430 Transcript_30962/m.77430 type:complete len:324 (+) Transcript_30962:3358-4329(+)
MLDDAQRARPQRVGGGQAAEGEVAPLQEALHPHGGELRTRHCRLNPPRVPAGEDVEVGDGPALLPHAAQVRVSLPARQEARRARSARLPHAAHLPKLRCSRLLRLRLCGLCDVGQGGLGEQRQLGQEAAAATATPRTARGLSAACRCRCGSRGQDEAGCQFEAVWTARVRCAVVQGALRSVHCFGAICPFRHRQPPFHPPLLPDQLVDGGQGGGGGLRRHAHQLWVSVLTRVDRAARVFPPAPLPPQPEAEDPPAAPHVERSALVRVPPEEAHPSPVRREQLRGGSLPRHALLRHVRLDVLESHGVQPPRPLPHGQRMPPQLL